MSSNPACRARVMNQENATGAIGTAMAVLTVSHSITVPSDS